MTEEEAIVISELEQLIEKARDLREEEFYTIFTIHEVQNISTALNLIQRQQEEIDKYKIESDNFWEEWNNLEQSCFEEEQKLKTKLEKKDKIIDEMAKDLFYKYYDDLRSIEDIKKYFEEKVEGK